MADEPTNNTNTQEETPAWAKQLQETLSDLPNRLKEALTPETPEPPPANQPIEIPMPQPPEPEEPPKPEEVETEPPQENQKKKRSLWDWLL